MFSEFAWVFYDVYCPATWHLCWLVLRFVYMYRQRVRQSLTPCLWWRHLWWTESVQNPFCLPMVQLLTGCLTRTTEATLIAYLLLTGCDINCFLTLFRRVHSNMFISDSLFPCCLGESIPIHLFLTICIPCCLGESIPIRLFLTFCMTVV